MKEKVLLEIAGIIIGVGSLTLLNTLNDRSGPNWELIRLALGIIVVSAVILCGYLLAVM